MQSKSINHKEIIIYKNFHNPEDIRTMSNQGIEYPEINLEDISVLAFVTEAPPNNELYTPYDKWNPIDDVETNMDKSKVNRNHGYFTGSIVTGIQVYPTISYTKSESVEGEMGSFS